MAEQSGTAGRAAEGPASIRARIERAKRALGKRGKPWWTDGA